MKKKSQTHLCSVLKQIEGAHDAEAIIVRSVAAFFLHFFQLNADFPFDFIAKIEQCSVAQCFLFFSLFFLNANRILCTFLLAFFSLQFVFVFIFFFVQLRAIYTLGHIFLECLMNFYSYKAIMTIFFTKIFFYLYFFKSIIASLFFKDFFLWTLLQNKIRTHLKKKQTNSMNDTLYDLFCHFYSFFLFVLLFDFSCQLEILLFSRFFLEYI